MTVATMSLADKAKQMQGTLYGDAFHTQFNDIQRSQDTSEIRGWRYRDASRGMNLGEDMDGATQNAAVVNGEHVGYSTVFPVSMARGAAFDLDLEYADRRGDRRRDAGRQADAVAGAVHEPAPAPVLGPRAGDLRRGSVPGGPPRHGDDDRRAAAHRRQRQALHGLRHRGQPRRQQLAARRADAARDLWPSLPHGGPGRRRRLRDGLVQPDQRREVHGERPPPDRRPAHGLRVQGIRPQRLVGDEAHDKRGARTPTCSRVTRSRRCTPAWTSSCPGRSATASSKASSPVS